MYRNAWRHRSPHCIASRYCRALRFFINNCKFILDHYWLGCQSLDLECFYVIGEVAMFGLDKKKLFLLSSICLLGFSAFAFSSGEKDAIDKRVSKYIQENPSAVYKAMVTYQQQQEQQLNSAKEKAIRGNKKDFFANGVSPVMGNPKGEITVVEFMDYQCGHCKVMGTILRDAIKERPKNVRVVIKQLPIFGKVSEYAARAALASTKQGKFFKLHHDLLNWKPRSKRQKNITEKIVDRIAKDAGVDVAKMKVDMQDKKYNKELKDTKRLAQMVGLRGTPYVIVADKSGKQIVPISGGVQKEQLLQMIDSMLDEYNSGKKDAKKDKVASAKNDASNKVASNKVASNKVAKVAAKSKDIKAKPTAKAKPAAKV